jgi:hypothetical protein
MNLLIGVSVDLPVPVFPGDVNMREAVFVFYAEDAVIVATANVQRGTIERSLDIGQRRCHDGGAAGSRETWHAPSWHEWNR